MTNAKKPAPTELPAAPSSTALEATAERRRLFALLYMRRYAPEMLPAKFAERMEHRKGEMLSLNEPRKGSAALLRHFSHYDLDIAGHYITSAKARGFGGLRRALVMRHFNDAMVRFTEMDESERPGGLSGDTEARDGSED